jgi:hypothetical protein
MSRDTLKMTNQKASGGVSKNVSKGVEKVLLQVVAV